MKILVFLLAIFTSSCLSGQDIVGEWNGVLKVQGIQLRIVFNISKTGTGYNATMDSPDQGAKGIPATSTSFVNAVLKIAVANAKIEYEGTLDINNIVIGNFKQGGQSFPMNLSRQKPEKQITTRPQEPVKPYTYYSEDITFENLKEGIVLAGTLTLPEKNGYFPVVVLISGSGPQNRDEELLGHKPFLVLSDYLTKNGIAVLRYDDRGTALSKGDFKKSNSLDFASDVESAVEYLKTRKEINKNKIGLVGHSEGGTIAPMVAAKSNDIDFIVLLAGTGIPGDQLLLLQTELIGKAAGMDEEELKKSIKINSGAYQIVKNSKGPDSLKNDLVKYFKQAYAGDSNSAKFHGMTEEAFLNILLSQLMSPWIKFFLRFDPAVTLKKVRCPVLAINGSKDVQVSPKENLEAIKKALSSGGNKDITIKELPGLNHLFQECTTGLPDEYATIEQTFSPVVMQEILGWIKMHTR